MATSPASGAFHFVIGGAGFLGSSIVRLLLGRGEKHVAVFDLSPAPPKLKHEGVQYFIPGDLTSEQSLTDALLTFVGEKGGPETVIYHTASPAASAAPKPELYEKVNVKGTRNVIEVARKLKVRKLVFTSSAGVVFDGHDLLNVDERLPYPTPAMDHYNDTKARAEVMVCLASGSPSDPSALLTVALRPAGIFGPNDRQALPGFFDVLKTRRTNFQIGNNENLFDWTYVDNVAHAHLLAADKLGAPALLGAGAAGGAGADGARELGTVHLADPVLGDDEKKSARARKVPTSEDRPSPPAPSKDYARLLPSTLSPETLASNLDVRPVIRNRFDQFWSYIRTQEAAQSQQASEKSGGDGADSLGVAGQTFFITNGAPVPFWDFPRALWFRYFAQAQASGALTAEQAKKYSPTPAAKAFVLPKQLGLVLASAAEAFGAISGRTVLFTRFKVTYTASARYHNIEKARRVLGYEPIVGMEEAINRSVEWWTSEHPANEYLK
ncbi:erg26, C-3 sterol dehydrogenase [Tilletia horrida]|nr:erg26, C-3 sterol dehydrogenase [Tilletia horrida]